MTHARSQQFPRREAQQAASEEIRKRAVVRGGWGDPTGPTPVVCRTRQKEDSRLVWWLRERTVCALKVCALKVCVGTQKYSLRDLPRDRLNTSLRKTVTLRSNRLETPVIIIPNILTFII